ncbi:FGGY family carbohydrate kinase [Fundicoccus culcitae]|uniref:FGGY family carbohydrate kinase n=1 Tax=Fundicoccus culcitae TaxID=2969821 RepID=A0ABY5P7D4_9LACT|nr:FGGY family carbohydrate kinase [Fundicoccus culcitae]UUX34400.1 FGGY family carbohydrate kinase [Fundicoccus culcitae]
MQYMISIDVGTTNLKMSLFTQDFQPLDGFHYGYKEVQMDDVKYELNLNEILQAIREGLIYFIEHHPIKYLELFITTAMHSIQLLNHDMSFFGNTLTWADRRGAELIQNRSKKQLETQYLTTGTPYHSMNPFYKLLSMKESLSNFKIGSIKDLIYYYLTDQWTIDVASASSSGLYSLKEHTWDNSVLNELHLSSKQLPIIENPRYSAKLTLNLAVNLAEAVVYIGTSDGVSSNYAFAGLENAAVLSIGTSHAVRIVSQVPKVNPLKQNFCYQIDAKDYLVGYPSNNGANVLQWISEIFNIDLEAMDAIIKKRPSIQGVFFPFINGERSPIWNDFIQANLSDLHRGANRESIIYSLVCGMLFNIRHNVDLLKEDIAFDKLGVVGGAMRLFGLRQLVADVLNLPIYIPQMSQAETLGTINLVKSIQIETDFDVIKPNLGQVAILDFAYSNYRVKLQRYLS